MWSLGIVVLQILRYFSSPTLEGAGNLRQTLFLKSPVEALQMGVVVRRPDSGMTMGETPSH